MKKEYLPIIITVLVLALVGQGIWLWRAYQKEHAEDFEMTPLETTEQNPPSGDFAKSNDQIPNSVPTGHLPKGDKQEPLTWSAQLKTQSKKLISVAPGKTTGLTATFQNTGTATWTNANTFLQLLVSDEADTSPWYHTSWLGKKRVATVKEATVAPEETGTFEFTVTAPSVPGTYTIALRPIYQANTKYLWLGADPKLRWTIDIRN